jgi:septal ring factor EnvC (AmiA/AmiB activator)
MPKGQTAEVGTTMVNQNGYHHTKTEEGWRLTHHIVAELKLGRALEPNEMVRFQDSDRTNLDPSNIMILRRKINPKRNTRNSIERQLARIEAEINHLTDKRRELEIQLASLANQVLIN